MHYKQLSWLSSFIVLGTIATTIPVSAQTNQSDTSGIQTFSSPTVSIDSINGNGVSQTTQYNPSTGTISGGGIDNPIQFGSANGRGSASGFGNGETNATNTGNGASTGANNGSQGSSSGESTADSQNGSDRGNSVATVECSTKSCLDALEANGNQKSEVSLNDVAALLDESLDTSLDNLAAIQQESQVATAPANEGPRRIARRSSNNQACGCANPASTSTSGNPRRIVRNTQGIGKGCGCANPTVEARKVRYREIQARQIVEKQLNESKKFIEQVNQIEPEKNIW